MLCLTAHGGPIDNATYEAMIADGSAHRLLAAMNAHGLPVSMTPPTYEELATGGARKAASLQTEAHDTVDPGWLERAMRNGKGMP